MIKQLDQEAFDLIFKAAQDLGFKTFETRPSSFKGHLPFVVVGSVQLLPIATKSYLLGECHCVVDIWGSDQSRKAVSDMSANLLNEISRKKKTQNGYRAILNLDTISVEIMIDQSMDTDLWRGRIMFELKLN